MHVMYIDIKRERERELIDEIEVAESTSKASPAYMYFWKNGGIRASIVVRKWGLDVTRFLSDSCQQRSANGG